LRVEEAAEYARCVEAGHAEPADCPIGGHERASVAVRQERKIGDWRERRRGSRAPLLARLSGGRSLLGGAHVVTQRLRERPSPQRTRLWSCHGQASAHSEEMTCRRVTSMLCCETAKRRSGDRGVRLGRCGASALVSRDRSDWQTISSSHRNIDRSIESLAHSVYPSGTATKTRSARVCSKVNFGNNIDPRHNVHIVFRSKHFASRAS